MLTFMSMDMDSILQADLVGMKLSNLSSLGRTRGW